MGLFAVGQPRDFIVDATNLCANPSFETNLNFWDGRYYGPGISGTFTREVVPWANWGTAIGMKTWGSNSSNVAGAGFIYGPIPTAPTATYETEAFMMCVQGQANLWATAQWFDSSGAQISTTSGSVVTAYAASWTSVRGSFVAPTGAATVAFGFQLQSGARFGGDQLVIDRVSIVPFVFVGYFDGNLNPTSTYRYSWDGPANNSVSRRSIDNPDTRVLPDLVLGYDWQTQSRNQVYDLLSGNVAAVLRPSSLRSGTLKLLFSDPAKAAVAERVHRGARFWEFADDDNVNEHMFYVVDGALRSYQDDSRNKRVLEIPYREITN